MNWKDWPVDEFLKRSKFDWRDTGSFNPDHPSDPAYHANKCLMENATDQDNLVTALEYQDIESGGTVYTGFDSWKMINPLYNYGLHDTLGEVNEALLRFYDFPLVEKCVIDVVQPRESRGKSKVGDQEKMTTKYKVFKERARLVSTTTGEKQQFKFKYLWKSFR